MRFYAAQFAFLMLKGSSPVQVAVWRPPVPQVHARQRRHWVHRKRFVGCFAMLTDIHFGNAQFIGIGMLGDVNHLTIDHHTTKVFGNFIQAIKL